ncbi:MAG: bifunctional demethylmenaquinone methyltransferase/2-methoxy-6-polyprenyl-1,4-benzoquinol methylase UbiE [Bacteroidales bacterium]
MVRAMFNNIAHRYDFLNHFLSAGIDFVWRRKAVNRLKEISPRTILDIATGTADLAIEAIRLKPEKIIGIDIAEAMLEHGRKKVRRKGLDNLITLETGDSEALRFADNSFDAVMVAFGVRNFGNLRKGLSEMHRVLKPGGMAVILEFSMPRKWPFRRLYLFYFRFILPLVGRLVSGDPAAYTYLPESVSQFPDGTDFLKILEDTGFHNTKHTSLTFGIASIYTGIR